MQTDNLFKHSGRFSVPGLMMAVVKGAVIGAILGAVYGVIAFYSPFFIINMLVMIGVAIAMGMLLEKPVKAGEIRNLPVAALAGLTVALVMLAVHWVVWLRLGIGVWVFDLELILASLQVIAAIGPWSIFDWTPRGGTLFAIWGLEAVTLIVIPTVMAWNTVRDTPYCEDSGKWAEVEYTQKNFAASDVESVKQKLLQNPNAVVELLQEPSEQDAEFLRFGLAKVPGSPLRTVSISKIIAKIKDGKVEEDSRTVLNNLKIDSSTFDKLAAACQ